MSNYNLQIPWSGKDSLNDNDPDKVVSGDDFNVEFLAVKTAVNSKADLAGSASQAFSATTAAANVNTTQVATTQYVTSAIGAIPITAAVVNALVYPVGSIYFNMAVSTNPATLLGMGTWVRYGQGRVLVGIQDSGTFDALDESLGSETHTLSVAELPSHTHTLLGGGFDGSSGAEPGSTTSANLGQGGATGGGAAHTNLQPSVTVYMWKRTA